MGYELYDESGQEMIIGFLGNDPICPGRPFPPLNYGNQGILTCADRGPDESLTTNDPTYTQPDATRPI